MIGWKRHLKRLVLAVMVLLVMVMGVLYLLANPEPRVLNAPARAAVPGSYLQLRAGTVRYQLSGTQNERTLVLLHGGGVNSMDVWDPLEAELSQTYRVLRYDRWGHGYSDRPAGAYDLDFFASQLEELLAALNITGPVDLAGFSLGGMIGTHYAVKHPERIRTLTLIAPAGVLSESTMSIRLLMCPGVGEYVMKVFGRRVAEGRYQSLQLAPKFQRFVMDREMKWIDFRGTGQATLTMLGNIPIFKENNLYEQAGPHHFPTLLFLGAEDKTVPAACRSRLEKAIPGLEVHVLSQASHGLIIDQAAQIRPIWLGFLKQREAAKDSPQLENHRRKVHGNQLFGPDY